MSQPPTQLSFFSLARELRDLIYYQLLHSVTNRPLGHNIHITAINIPIAHVLCINKQFTQEYQSASNELSSLTILNHDDSTPSSHDGQQRPDRREEPSILISPSCTYNSTLSYHLTLSPPIPSLPPSIVQVPHITFSLLASRFRSAGDELAVLELWTDGILAQFELKSIKSVCIDVILNNNRSGGGGFGGGGGGGGGGAWGGGGVVEFESALLWSGNWTSLIRLKRLGVWRRSDDGGGGREGGWDVGVAAREEKGKSILLLEWERERCRFAATARGGGAERANVWLNTAGGYTEM